jgi:hypothetical protein
MAIVEDHEIKLTDKQGFTMARYSKGDEYFRLQDGAHTTSFATFEAADLIAFLQRVQDMQKPTPALGKPEWKAKWQVTEVRTSEPAPSVWLPNCKPGDVCVRRDGERDTYVYNDGSSSLSHNVGGCWHNDDGRVSESRESYLDIIAVIPADHNNPSGTCVYAGTQRDYGDERPDDDGFITAHPRPRRDGPGLDVKALADLESRN